MNRLPTDVPIQIRSGTRKDFPLLQELERDAAVRFRDLPDLPEIPDDVTPLAELEAAMEAGLLWIAALDRTVAGYAYASLLDGNLHLEEVSVSQEFGRRGIGRRLVQCAIDRAKAEGRPAVTLTTFRDVPWNAPFYARLGFRELEASDQGAGLRTTVEDEERRGLPGHLRVAMIYPLHGTASDDR